MRRLPLASLPFLALLLPAQQAPDRAALQRDLAAFAERQLADKQLPAICLACLDAGADGVPGWRWSAAFGEAAPGRAATPAAVHRVASISKWFTATAALLLVQQGKLELDAPVTKYLPRFAPHNPFGGEITLRHLLAHRAGLVRESPLGHYFDASMPSLQATVASLNDTELTHAPGAAYQYSNPGLGVVGLVIEQVTGQRFEDAARELVLQPLQMADSSFDARADLLQRQAHGAMWTYDGRAIATPGFPFGYASAANLRSTVDDLLSFGRSMLAMAPRRLLEPASLQQMFTVQFAAPDALGAGLGCFVGRLDGHRRVRHGGAVYGFASTLAILPDDGLAAAVVSTLDVANAVSDAIADRALLGMLAQRQGRPLPAAAAPQPLGRERALALCGRYLAGDRFLDLLCRGDDLVLRPDTGVDARLRQLDGRLTTDDRTSMGSRALQLQGDGRVRFQGRDYARRDAPPPAAPAALLPYLGDYGWDFDTLFVYEDEGRLCALIEWTARAVLEPVGEDTFRFPTGNLYAGDKVVFARGADGAVTACTVGGCRFPRLPAAATAGTFRITPVAPIAQLREAAAKASPPPQPEGLRAPELVPLAEVVDGLRFDIRYATADNFLGVPVYEQVNAMLQRPAALALRGVQQQLAKQGLGLLVHDAYRPWSVTKVFWDATPVAQHEFVADPAKGSRHNRGCAVDLTLCELASGTVVEMPSGYDEFTARAYPDFAGGTGRQRWYRELLYTAMAKAGFTVYEREWWHFDYRDWQQYPVLNQPL